ncbi:pyruvate dehydrogenase complex dihydrolipoyllysine-residue acetyltransferase [Catenovulum adriaticum]|uniref:Acetyltransferase component of pyruvate dehydrogenase complex n=1 Tax=Catenovulum adriaticum TaxID=2984846 RepID=A0ABY7AJE8_9ALTE|nr:pyruvate dehydrogenase complex dihydrolipoyllysine-residue acetyltransferase [Catenovulum sp. TS8]WAJ69697.1 pyruvate dehydrogenase complex dihydrolipoyllysine-residue acetyltransferase [Catenovulum sp. TS8]
MAIKDVLVPDVGGEEVEVIELCVAPGDTVEAEDSLITVESDKASMDIPAPFAGTVKEIKTAVGDKVSEGTLIVTVEDASSEAAEQPKQEEAKQEASTKQEDAPAKSQSSGSTSTVEVKVPDIGGDTDVEVIEVLVAQGDKVEAEEGLITLETDKATMDVPCPQAGTVKELKISVGDKASEGTLVLILETEGGDEASASDGDNESAPAQAAPESEPAASGATELKEVKVPDIGGDENVDIIELLVAVGDEVNAEDGLITLETDKATMDVPAPFSGTVKELKVAVGDKVSEGSLIAMVETKGEAPTAKADSKPAEKSAPAAKSAPEKKSEAPKSEPTANVPAAANGKKVHASPSVRRTAREFGVDLALVPATGPKGRILKEDVQKWVKAELAKPKSSGDSAGNGGFEVLAAPKIDFSKFGEIEEKPLSRIQKISGKNLHRNWVTIPHVTQFDEADITAVEEFRKEQNAYHAKVQSGLKITPLVFVMKAAAKSLTKFPTFNSSLSSDGENLILKKFINIGIAVDTPNGLVVPVIKDVDKKGIEELSRELIEVSKKARDGKLKSADMQGGCFTISSLGGIGGTAFTPIVNWPEVAILGVSKAEMKPKWNGSEFVPKLMCPLSLSYDHRVIDGALGAKFSVDLAANLSDIRRLVL